MRQLRAGSLMSVAAIIAQKQEMPKPSPEHQAPWHVCRQLDHPERQVRDDSPSGRECLDGIDGLRDGLIDDPRECHFDFSTLECKGGSLVLVFDSWSSRVGEHTNDTCRSSGYG
jgi:hypothetical protein